ncbi:MAG: GNAT family N-acetyltransferase [Pseudomonadales bacterium]|nr:N-acetyltransferase [Pseudomonadales bacterium]
MTERRARILHSINEIEARVWNRCANPEGLPFNPFLSHEFFSALEESGSACTETGWQPFHLVLEEGADAGQSGPGTQVLGTVPMYVKGHSQGEYVFDHAWADAWHRAGRNYYPKLQVSVPFTPATGRRLLSADAGPATDAALLSACAQICEQVELSSAHITFMPKDQWQTAGELGYLQRIDQQYHWHNPGYRSFDDFLADLSAKKRKNLRRERREALENGISIEWVSGDDLTESHWDAFYRFYLDTGGRKWGSPYLTRSFFSHISATLAEHVLLILCRREGRYVAGALNFIGTDTLYGRNWGAVEYHPFLHFETCYYQAIDFAIERGLKRVEAGAQGSHKVARGYLPEATYSAHWIRDPEFRRAVAHYLRSERAHVTHDIEYVEQHAPFRNGVDLSTVRGIVLKPDQDADTTTR